MCVCACVVCVCVYIKLTFHNLLNNLVLIVLQAYSVYDREVGYCQGSPFIVGMLLMQVKHCFLCNTKPLEVVTS